jgi:PRC-barrel domain
MSKIRHSSTHAPTRSTSFKNEQLMIVRPMTTNPLSFLGLSLLTAIFMTFTADDGRPQAGSSEMRLVGMPVFSADGIEIGQVADVSTADGQIDQIRVTTGSALGFGERIITIPQPAFMIRRGTVIIPDFSAEDVEAFPSTSSESDGPRGEKR